MWQRVYSDPMRNGKSPTHIKSTGIFPDSGLWGPLLLINLRPWTAILWSSIRFLPGSCKQGWIWEFEIPPEPNPLSPPRLSSSPLFVSGIPLPHKNPVSIFEIWFLHLRFSEGEHQRMWLLRFLMRLPDLKASFQALGKAYLGNQLIDWVATAERIPHPHISKRLFVMHKGRLMHDSCAA